jgi:hypothetical protein
MAVEALSPEPAEAETILPTAERLRMVAGGQGKA